MSSVVLVGLPGTGKTTVARALGELRHRTVLDTDDVVATNVGVSASQYLRDEGESAFRQRELAALREALEEPEVVIATGGGIVCTPEARAALSREFTVWLDCEDEVILTRLGDSERPLLDDRPAETLARLRTERSAWYDAVSSARVDTTSSLEDVVALVAREVDRLTR